MIQTQLKERVLNLEAQLEFIKKAFVKEPNFAVDQENWNKTRVEAKKMRKNLYRTLYGKKWDFSR